MCRARWLRLVLDEAHAVKNAKTAVRWLGGREAAPGVGCLAGGLPGVGPPLRPAWRAARRELGRPPCSRSNRPTPSTPR